MAHTLGVRIEDVATEGPGLVFVVYPAAIATMPASTFWAASFVKSQGFPRWKSGKGHTLTLLPDPHPTVQLSNHPTIQPATWPPFPDPSARGPHPDLDQTREYATRSNPNHSALRENDS